jgi:hypothetical protein
MKRGSGDEEMVELIIATSVFLVLLFIARGTALVHWTLLVGVGTAVTALGLSLGIVAGIGYHVTLYRALSPRNLLGRNWLWKPTSYHDRIPPAERRTVMSWFYAGVTTMVVALAGCGLVLAGILAI